MTPTNRFVVDTHALIWHLGEFDRLPIPARKKLRAIDKGESKGLIPVIVLAKAAYIFEKGKTGVSLKDLLGEIDKGDNYRILDFDREQLEKMVELKKVPEMHDRIIVAAADVYGAGVITRDEEIRNSKAGESTWD